jgi:hypothetical protein
MKGNAFGRRFFTRGSTRWGRAGFTSKADDGWCVLLLRLLHGRRPQDLRAADRGADSHALGAAQRAGAGGPRPAPSCLRRKPLHGDARLITLIASLASPSALTRQVRGAMFATVCWVGRRGRGRLGHSGGDSAAPETGRGGRAASTDEQSSRENPGDESTWVLGVRPSSRRRSNGKKTGGAGSTGL